MNGAQKKKKENKELKYKIIWRWGWCNSLREGTKQTYTHIAYGEPHAKSDGCKIGASGGP